MSRSYEDFCPIARTLNVVGEKWSLLILRDLVLHETRRFQELETGLNGISPNTLSSRLKSLEENEIISRRIYEEHPPRLEYFLTKKGKAIGPVLKELHKWGENYE